VPKKGGNVVLPTYLNSYLLDTSERSHSIRVRGAVIDVLTCKSDYEFAIFGILDISVVVFL